MTAHRTSASDADVIEAIAEVMRESRAAALTSAWPLIVDRLREIYGRELVDRAVQRYMRALRQENRLLERQLKHHRGRTAGTN
jgi:hypothetical protein